MGNLSCGYAATHKGQLAAMKKKYETAKTEQSPKTEQDKTSVFDDISKLPPDQQEEALKEVQLTAHRCLFQQEMEKAKPTFKEKTKKD